MRTVVQVAHGAERLVEALAFVIARIFAAVLHLAVGAEEEREEVFSIRIVAVPAPEEDLGGALLHFFLEAVVVGRANFELNAEFGELPLIPLEVGLVALRGLLIVEDQYERHPRFRVSPVGVARFREKALGLIDRAAHGARDAVERPHFVGHGIEGLRPVGAPAENAGRHRAARGRALILLENREILLPVDSDRERLAQEPVAPRAFCRRPQRDRAS